MKHLRIGLGGKTVFTQLFILVLFAGISMAAHAQTVVKGNINDPQG